MATLVAALAAWDSPHFGETLKSELEGLGAALLPLSQCVCQGGYVGDTDITVIVLSFSSNDSVIDAKVGVFFTEVVGGCGCPIEPFDDDVYCVLAVTIDKYTGDSEFGVIP